MYIKTAIKIENIGKDNNVLFLVVPNNLNLWCFLSYKKSGLYIIIDIIINIYTFMEFDNILFILIIY